MRQERRISNPVRPRRPGSGSGPRARRRAIEASEPARGEFDEVAHNTAVLLAHMTGVDDALQVEWVISRFLPCWGERPAGFNADYIESAVLAVVEKLASTADQTALLALRGLEAVASGAMAEAAGAAARRLAAQGIAMPPWGWQVGQAQAVEARMSGNDEDASLGVIVEYAYPDGAGHALAAFVADDMGGAVKFLGMMKPFDEARGGEDLALAEVDPEHAQTIVREALDATDQAHALFEGDPSVHEFGSLAWSRVRA